MESHDPQTEETNLQRLIQSGMAPQARPGRELRDQTLARLRQELRALQPEQDFPLPALGLLLLVLAGMGLWLIIQPEAPIQPGLASIIVGLTLALNLIWIPIAGVVIIQRRRNATQS